MIEFEDRTGVFNPDLTVGVDVTTVTPLLANEGICSPGVKLHGTGFIVTPEIAEHLGLGRRKSLEKHIRDYRNGRDLTARPRGVMVIDLLGLNRDDVRSRSPEVYQHLLTTVKPERDRNNRAAYRDCSSPIDTATIAAGFRQGRRVAPQVNAVLTALTRTGFVTTTDAGRTFTLRRVA